MIFGFMALAAACILSPYPIWKMNNQVHQVRTTLATCTGSMSELTAEELKEAIAEAIDQGDIDSAIELAENLSDLEEAVANE